MYNQPSTAIFFTTFIQSDNMPQKLDMESKAKFLANIHENVIKIAQISHGTNQFLIDKYLQSNELLAFEIRGLFNC